MHKVQYIVQDEKRSNPVYGFHVHATRAEIHRLVNDGYLLRYNLLPNHSLLRIRTHLDRIAHDERNFPDDCFGGSYLRFLEDKDELFLRLLANDSLVSIAKAVLGPEIQADEVVARVVSKQAPADAVPWHIHFRVVPHPIPPFFCYPHAINCLLYLDPVSSENGALCLLPGSHRLSQYKGLSARAGDLPGQEVLTFPAGTCVIMHGNLWHRVLASRHPENSRRVVILGYLPSWMRKEERGGLRPSKPLTKRLRRAGPDKTRALLGEFFWG